MRFYCEDHGKDLYVSRLPGRVVCYAESEVERHYLGEFPTAEFWEYCCNCETTWRSGSQTNPLLTTKCPRCKSSLTGRYLCDQCGVFTVEAEDAFTDRAYVLVAGESPARRGETGSSEPSCPGCLKASHADVHDHNCARAKVVFWSARKNCPFCNDPIGPPPTFPVLAADFLDRIRSKDKVTVGFDILEIENNLLVDSSQGQFIIVLNGSRKTQTILLPKRTIFESSDDRELYSNYYDSESTHIGDVRILSPAVVKKTRDGWVLVERGRLEVVAAGNKTAESSPAVPKRAADYLKEQREETVVFFNRAHHLLVPDPTGKGTLTIDKSRAGANLLLPRVTAFSGKKGFQRYFSTYYESFYDCPHIAAGELWIVSPALVENVKGGWRLAKKGILEVRASAKILDQPTASTKAQSWEEADSNETGDRASVSSQIIPATPKSTADEKNLFASIITTEPRATDKRKRIIVGAVIALFIVGAFSMWPGSGPTAPRETATQPSPAAPSLPQNMVYVSGGTFLMGNESGDDYEKPAHKVTVRSFFIDKYEVTCEEYVQFLKEINHTPPAQWKNGTYPAGWASKPVTGVDWDDATAYANWAGKRLPTEEEWEFAARGTDGRRYPWGNDWQPGAANADGASKGLTEVGKYKNGVALKPADMIGNAWEWTASPLVPYPGGRLPPQPTGDLKVIRGGSWQSDRASATTTYRWGWPARGGKDYSNTGFRCVKDIPSESRK